MSSEDKRIRLRLIDTSDDPRVLLFGSMDMDIGALQHCFRDLNKSGLEIRLEEQPFFVPLDLIQLHAKCTGPEVKKPRSKEVFKIGKTKFDWCCSSERWDDLAELIDGLANSVSPGHQYLTNDRGDDATIVISMGEYSIDLQ